MKKIRRICLSNKQVLKKEEMGHVVAGDVPNNWEWHSNGCQCTNIGDRDLIWREIDATQINWEQLLSGLGNVAEGLSGAYLAPFTGVGLILVGGCYMTTLEGYSKIKDALNSHGTTTIYAYQQLHTLTPIKTHIIL